MIIINIIILYFIQITHSDDFPSTSTREVLFNMWFNIILIHIIKHLIMKPWQCCDKHLRGAYHNIAMASKSNDLCKIVLFQG